MPDLLPEIGQDNLLIPGLRRVVAQLLNHPQIQTRERITALKDVAACQNVRQLQRWQRSLTAEIKRREVALVGEDLAPEGPRSTGDELADAYEQQRFSIAYQQAA